MTLLNPNDGGTIYPSMQPVQEGGRCLCLSLHWPPFSHIYLLWHDWQAVSCQSAQMRRAICLNHTASKAPATHERRSERKEQQQCFSPGKSSISITLCLISPYWSVCIIKEVVSWGVCALWTQVANTTAQTVWESMFVWCNTLKICHINNNFGREWCFANRKSFEKCFLYAFSQIQTTIFYNICFSFMLYIYLSCRFNHIIKLAMKILKYNWNIIYKSKSKSKPKKGWNKIKCTY